jgi:hypothetical protein
VSARRRAGVLAAGFAVAAAWLVAGSALGVEPSASPDRITIDDIQVVGVQRYVSTDAEVDALEAELGMTMPVGYREFVTRLGHGNLCSLRVTPPAEMLVRLQEHIGMMAVYWFWTDPLGEFGQDEAMASVPIADTWHGDQIVAWPGDPDRLYVLWRNADSVYAWDRGLLDLAEFLCRGETDPPPGAALRFEPVEPWAFGPRDLPPPIEPDSPPPDATASAREVLTAYFEELVTTQAWAIDAVGGEEALEAESVPEDLWRRVGDEYEARLAGIHRRYASPPVALIKRGSTEWTAPAERSRFTIVEEERIGDDRVRILARRSDGTLLWSTLERGPDGWRVIMEENGYDPDV